MLGIESHTQLQHCGNTSSPRVLSPKVKRCECQRALMDKPKNTRPHPACRTGNTTALWYEHAAPRTRVPRCLQRSLINVRPRGQGPQNVCLRLPSISQHLHHTWGSCKLLLAVDTASQKHMPLALNRYSPRLLMHCASWSLGFSYAVVRSSSHVYFKRATI